MVARDIIGLNIVIVIDNIDTSFFSQYWFIINRVFSPKEIQNSSIFVPGLTNISSNDCQIVVTPQNIQFVIKTNDMGKSYECIKRRLQKMIDAMPLVPIKAIGLNITWKILDNERNVPEFSRECFFVEDNPVYDFFKNPDARFGSYFSQNYDDSTRLKLDIKPVFAQTSSGSEEFLMASFNYHRDIQPDKRQAQITEQLHKWSNVIANSKKIVCSLI